MTTTVVRTAASSVPSWGPMYQVKMKKQWPLYHIVFFFFFLFGHRTCVSREGLSSVFMISVFFDTPMFYLWMMFTTPAWSFIWPLHLMHEICSCCFRFRLQFFALHVLITGFDFGNICLSGSGLLTCSNGSTHCWMRRRKAEVVVAAGGMKRLMLERRRRCIDKRVVKSNEK